MKNLYKTETVVTTYWFSVIADAIPWYLYWDTLHPKFSDVIWGVLKITVTFLYFQLNLYTLQLGKV